MPNMQFMIYSYLAAIPLGVIGGVLALEVARLLQDRGDEVSLVAMIDSRVPKKARRGRRRKSALQKGVRYFDQLLDQPTWRERLGYLRKRWGQLRERRRQRAEAEAEPEGAAGHLREITTSAGYRLTLCRCGASKNKPFCDGSHHETGFNATGEPPAGDKIEMLAVRDGPIEIAPQADGPLMVRGNMEIISGTGRMVARMQAARFCRCGHSQNKPFCDGSHVKAGFRS